MRKVITYLFIVKLYFFSYFLEITVSGILCKCILKNDRITVLKEILITNVSYSGDPILYRDFVY